MEINERINLENINPISTLESNGIDLNQKLILITNDVNNKYNPVDIKNEANKYNNIKNNNKNEVKGSLISYENLNINDFQEDTNENNDGKNLIEKELYNNIAQVNENDNIDDMFRSSKLSRQSFQKILKNNNIDKKYTSLPINKTLLKKFMIILKYLIGGLLTSGSILLLIIIIKDKITDQKLIGIIIEPIIILISLLGMFFFKNIIYKKILFALFIWEGTYLIPLSFYVKASIKDDYIFYFDIILKIRIGLFIIQIVNFIIYLAFKLDL